MVSAAGHPLASASRAQGLHCLCCVSCCLLQLVVPSPRCPLPAAVWCCHCSACRVASCGPAGRLTCAVWPLAFHGGVHACCVPARLLCAPLLALLCGTVESAWLWRQVLVGLAFSELYVSALDLRVSQARGMLTTGLCSGSSSVSACLLTGEARALILWRRWDMGVGFSCCFLKDLRQSQNAPRSRASCRGLGDRLTSGLDVALASAPGVLAAWAAETGQHSLAAPAAQRRVLGSAAD